MTLAAFLLTWIGAGLIVLGSLVMTWYDGSTFLDLSDDALGSNPLDFAGAPNVYLTLGWFTLLGLIAVFGPFAMFSGPRDKWIGFVGHLALAAFLGYGAYNTWGNSGSRADTETRVMILFYVAAGLSVLMAVAAVTRRAWAGALVTLLAALVGAVLSIWTIAEGVPSAGDSFSVLSWVVPLGFILVVLGALVSIAVNGKNRTEHPLDRGKGKATQRPTPPPVGWGSTATRV